MTEYEWIKNKIIAEHEVMKGKMEEIRYQLAGCKARILSNYNGQPMGRSRPSQKGRIVTIQSVAIGEDHIACLPEGELTYIPLRDLELVEEQEDGES